MKVGTGVAWRAAGAPVCSRQRVDYAETRGRVVDELPGRDGGWFEGMFDGRSRLCGPAVRFKRSAIMEAKV